MVPARGAEREEATAYRHASVGAEIREIQQAMIDLNDMGARARPYR
jgi:hypothetical protein